MTRRVLGITGRAATAPARGDLAACHDGGSLTVGRPLRAALAAAASVGLVLTALAGALTGAGPAAAAPSPRVAAWPAGARSSARAETPAGAPWEPAPPRWERGR